jgi:hypothetical protein
MTKIIGSIYLCLIMPSRLMYYFNIQDVHLLLLERCNIIEWSLKHAFAFYISLLFLSFLMCSLAVEQKAAYLITEVSYSLQ